MKNFFVLLLLGVARSIFSLNNLSLPFEVKKESFSQSKSISSKKLEFTQQIFTQKFYQMPIDFTQPEVQHYIKLYQRTYNREIINRSLKRSRPFCLFIYQQLSKKGLPEELFYLPVIESEFLNMAKSSAGALGMWQIMQNSLSHSMRISPYRDDRLNFWKSTESALARLEDNYKRLGDWRLSLCAYNAGYARISKLIKESGLRNFWSLARNKVLPSDTCEYLPKFYAIVYLASRSVQSGLEVHWDKSMNWSLIEIKQPLPLQKISQLAGIPTELLQLGNAELKQMHTPKDSYAFFLKVPSHWHAQVEKGLISQSKPQEHLACKQGLSYPYLPSLSREEKDFLKLLGLQHLLLS